MSLTQGKDISVSLTSFFMKFVGLWLVANRVEKYCRYFALLYSVATIAFSMWIQTRDLYFSWGDFGTCIYIACNIMCLIMALFKIFILFIHRKGFLSLVLYMQENFWHSNYDSEEKIILDRWKRPCNFLVCFFTFFIEAANSSYAIRPLLTNIGKNESDRVLPFNMWLDLPLSISPYYEITFLIQFMSLFHVGVCYFCFDNFLCIMNLHVSAQFCILQHRLTNLYNVTDTETADENLKITSYPAEKCYSRFRACIQQHQKLIAFCDKLEEVFKAIVLGQVLTFSLLICLVGYQVILADITTTKRLTFVFLLAGTMCQLLMFTYSCDCLIQESTNVALAVYAGPWLHLPMDVFGRMLRKDLLLIVMKSRRPCCLTASGFFPISLETYTGILSTAMSYFTLLKQGSIDTVDA